MTSRIRDAMAVTAAALILVYFCGAAAIGQNVREESSKSVETRAFLIYAPSRSSESLLVVSATDSTDGLNLTTLPSIKLDFPASTIVHNSGKNCLYLAAARSEESGTPGAVVWLSDDGRHKEHAAVSLRHGYCFLSLDRKKRLLLGVDYFGGHVDAYGLSDRGVPDEGVTLLNEGRRNAHCVLPSPDNRFVYIPYVKDSGAIFQYAFDADNKILTALEPKNAEPPEGTGPRHLAYHPTMRIVYFSNEQLPGASAYQITDSGELKLRQVCAAFDSQQDLTGVSSSDITITPDGKLLFVGIRGHRQNLDRIARFQVLPDGGLKLLGLTEADEVPWGLTLSPDGRYLLVTTFRGGTLSAYTIKPEGALALADRMKWDMQISDLVTVPTQQSHQ